MWLLCPMHQHIPIALILLSVDLEKNLEKNMPPIVRCLWLAPLESVEWLRLEIDGSSL